MAFQQGAVGTGGAGQGEHHGPVGTEYTLQGVMRFLQMEWHNHERARNAWDIERAEMKAKIIKSEGENRHLKRLNEQMERQRKMLEAALKNERAKNKSANNGNGAIGESEAMDAESQTDLKSKARGLVKEGDVKKSERPTNRAQASKMLTHMGRLWLTDYTEVHNSFLDTADTNKAVGNPQDYIDMTSKHLKQAMQEIQVLLIPPEDIPSIAHMIPNGHFAGLPDPTMPPEDLYSRHQQRNARQPSGHVYAQQPLPNHQPPPIPNSLPQSSGSLEDAHSSRYADLNASPSHPEALPPSTQHIAAPYEEPVETVTHTFDSRGRPVNDQDAPAQPRRVRQTPDPDGWTFDEEAPLHPENPPSEMPRRPDTDVFPNAANNSHAPAKSPPRTGPASHRRKSSGSQAMSRRRSSQGKSDAQNSSDVASGNDPSQFKVKFALRGHLDVVRSVIFSGGGSPSEPEVCTTGDDGTIKRWIVPATYQSYNPGNNNADLDIQAYFTHRGHEGVVTCLATCPASTGFSTGGRANGDGWIFSGGQDATVRVWERGRVDPKATLEGHTDSVWAVCVLPASVGVVFGPQSSSFGGPDRLLLVSGSADGTVKVWAVSAPPQTSSPATGSRRGVGGSRRHSVTSGSNFPSSPQPSVASPTVFSYTLIHTIERPGEHKASPTSICPLSPSGETFVVSYSDSSVLIFDTRSGEELIGMASSETYDGTMSTSINTVVATSTSLEGAGNGGLDTRGIDTEEVSAGATGNREGLEGVVITGHEDRFVRFFDANSGQCTYNMLAHPSAISALSLSKDGREAVSAGHDASIRFWSLEKRICTQDIISHRAMRGEGVCDVCWSQDGRLVISAGGDGVVKVFAR